MNSSIPPLSTFSHQEYDDEWSQNPDLSTTWGINQGFKDKFEQGFQVT